MPGVTTRAIVGTNDGNVQMGFNLGQGVANSATWVNVTGGNTVLPNRPILDVYQDTFDPLIGYAAVGGFDQNTPTTPGHVFQVTCTANCATFTWLDKSGNLPNIPADSIMVNPNYRQQVFVGTDWGLYYTNDIDAATPVWYRFQAGLPNAMIWDMTVDTGATTLAVWTRSRGAYVWPLPSTPFRTCPDYNGNGGIDVIDIGLVAGAWTTTTASPNWNNRYDRNNDGVVDIIDIMLVSAQFGNAC